VTRFTAYWGFIVLGVGSTLLGPALSPILADFHVSPSGTGPLFLGGSAGYVLAVLIGGPAGDRWNRGSILQAGALLMGVGGVLLALVPAWSLLVAGFCVLSIGSGVIDSGTNALVNDIAPARGHAREQSLLHTFFGLGALLGPLLIGAFLAIHWGWRSAYVVDAVGAIGLAMLFSQLRLHRPVPKAQAVGARSMLALARTPLVLVMALMLAVYVGAELLVGDWSATYLQDTHHFDKVAAATSVGLFWGGLTAGRLLSAVATRWFTGRTLLLLTCLLSLFACVVLVAAPNAPTALAGLALTGIGFAAIFPLVMAIAGEVFPGTAGSIAGLLMAAASVFGALLPWVGGVMVQYADARAALALSIPLGLVMVIVAIVLRESHPLPRPAMLPASVLIAD